MEKAAPNNPTVMVKLGKLSPNGISYHHKEKGLHFNYVSYIKDWNLRESMI